MTKFLRSLAALLLLLTGPLAAQQSQPTPQPVVAVPVQEALRPALWKVADADTTIYLFGTIHALPADLAWLEGTIANALDESDELVTEIPEPNPEQMQALVLTRAILPAGQTLRGLLPPEEHKAYEAAMTANGVPPAAFERFKPWYVGLALTTLPLLRDGYAVENGVEQALTARHKGKGKAHLALETIEFQLGMFDDLPLASQRAFLSEVIAGQKDLRSQLDQIVRDWGAGKEDKLAELLNQTGDDPAMRERIFTQRNSNWVGWIRTRMARPGTSFMAVGAGHLSGADSVIDLLGKRGLTVTRIQ